jgi:DNA adenine methylase
VLFPYFGSKRKAAPIVWGYLGNPECYLEPFAGSLAVLLNRPDPPLSEVVCDLDGYIANFWRAIRDTPGEVTAHLNGPVAEVDMQAYQRLLVDQRGVITPKLESDPTYSDPHLAAIWWMGISSFLGSGWAWRNARQRPHIDRTLKSVYSASMTDERIAQVAARLATVVILSGNWDKAWARVATSAILSRFSTVGVFLDPPYAGKRSKGLYAEDMHLHDEVLSWCRQVPLHVAVVLAGYDGEYDLPWRRVRWKAHNGYAAEANNRRSQEILYVKEAGVRYLRRPPTTLTLTV